MFPRPFTEVADVPEVPDVLVIAAACVRRALVLVVVPVLVVLGTASAAEAQDGVAAREDHAAAAASVARLVEREMAAKRLPALSIALVDGREVVWAQAFGFARPRDSVRATMQMVHRVGSVSKPFVALAIMRLVEQRRLDLDAPVTRWLPDFRPAGARAGEVTLRHLLSHHAGLVREPPVGSYFDAAGASVARTVASLNGTPLVYPPGDRIKYSNAGVTVAGRVIERVTGRPFAEWVRDSVLAPLGMVTSAFEPTPLVRRGLATAEMWTLDGRTFAAPTFEMGIAPAGALYASMLDLARAAGAMLDGPRVVSRGTLAEMWTPQFAPPGARQGAGLGFFVGELDGHRWVGHGGAVYGFASEMRMLPDDGLAVVVATTADAANAVTTRIANHALRALLASRRAMPPPLEPETRVVDPALARRLDGRWRSAERPGAGVELTERGGRLFAVGEQGGAESELRVLAGDTLVLDDRLSWGTRLVVQPGGSIAYGGATLRRVATRAPAPVPAALRPLVGEYGWPHEIVYVTEREGDLWVLVEWFWWYRLRRAGAGVWSFPDHGLYAGEQVRFHRDGAGRATGMTMAGVRLPRRAVGPEDGAAQMRIVPQRPVEELRVESLAAAMPAQPDSLLAPGLVELTSLDSTIRLDIRYATTNNFLGTAVYSQARAFLQRPAAEALVRAHRALRPLGYGLLVHDGYRPWYVTRMFWEATPPPQREFVADPSRGSRHNRGAAVDLTLYDLKTGRAVEMPSTYDEFSDRAYPDYPGGTSLQHWHRRLLRRTMEREGFSVFDVEWWHFDYGQWRRFPILNRPFESLP